MECVEPRRARLQAPLSVDCGHSAMSVKTPPGVLKSPVTPHPHFLGLKERGACTGREHFGQLSPCVPVLGAGSLAQRGSVPDMAFSTQFLS